LKVALTEEETKYKKEQHVITNVSSFV